MLSRRDLFRVGVAGPMLAPAVRVAAAPQAAAAYVPVVTPNGATLPWVMKDGVKEFHLIAEPVEREIATGMKVN